MKRVGIYAGTFDPVHEGHLAFARQAITQCKLDKVFFLVEPRPRRKQGVKALEHRQQMVQLAIAEESKLGSILINQEKFTVIDTMPVLQARFKGAELHLLMGDDVLRHLVDWPHLADLAESTCFTIGLRKGTTAAIKRHISAIEKTRGLHFNYSMFEAPESSVSSSLIRRAIKQGKKPEAVPGNVLAYIKEYGLYSSSDGGM